MDAGILRNTITDQEGLSSRLRTATEKKTLSSEDSKKELESRTGALEKVYII